MPDLECHLCGRVSVESIPEYAELCRVTSDCKPWPRGGRLGACRSCGTIQKALDQDWWSEAEAIYRDYNIYYQSAGAEQAVFSPGSGESASRSRRLIDRVTAEVVLPEHGRLLDIGCGNGALLKVFSALKPGWRLAGAELSDKYRAAVEEIPGVSRFYSCPPEQIPDTFEVITLIHALEHIHRPAEFLQRLHRRLAPGGLVLVEVPDAGENPFDLLVADHASHFTQATAAQVLRRADYSVEHIAADWVPKELTIVARSEAVKPAGDNGSKEDGLAAARRQIEWLRRVIAAARTAAAAAGDERRFGIFGTSIAATWLSSELSGLAGFFVDEDPNRVGREFMGKPILHPDQVARGQDVFVALPPALAGQVSRRLHARGAPFVCHVPPPFIADGEPTASLLYS